MARGRRAKLAAALAANALLASAAPQNNQFEIVGNSGVSAQQLFLSTANKVVVIDKTEGNGNNLEVNGHVAWATEYDVNDNTYRALDVETNTFCAGGNVLGDGRWLNVGGNRAVGYGGLNAESYDGPYVTGDGGPAVRVWTPCDDGKCEWTHAPNMTTRRWYPTLETLEEGNMIIIGGCDYGGYVNDASQNNPTYEYWPSQGRPTGLNILTTTLPANLFPHTFLLPSGNLLIQANLGTEIFDYKNNVEHPLPNMPHAVRTYPGSAATAMLPLTPANNWTATVIFCGGTNLQPDQWVQTWNIAAYPADATCVSMTPDVSTDWVDEDTLPEGRSMGNMIALPDGRFVILNGQRQGTAGYGNTSWAIGQSFGDNPIFEPVYYDVSKPKGERFYRAGVGSTTVPRMYHSSAVLLPDGSIMSAGSNPNADYVAPGTPGYKYPTEYRVERFYPDYYTSTRPKPSGLPTSIGYGGNYFNIQLSESDVGDSSNLANTKVTIVRPGFSTHAMNMGQRIVQLDSTAEYHTNKTATLHVSNLPPNPAILAPGPAYLFVVVNGVPSIGQYVMVGNGVIGAQPTAPAADLPANVGFANNGNPTDGSSSSGRGNSSDGFRSVHASLMATAMLATLVLALVSLL